MCNCHLRFSHPKTELEQTRYPSQDLNEAEENLTSKEANLKNTSNPKAINKSTKLLK